MAWPQSGGSPATGSKSALKRTDMKHIIAVLLENEPGALSRVVALFSARGYNIESLTVAPTEDPSLSRMTIVTTGSDEVIEQITKHLNRLIEVVKVVDLTEGSYTERELMLIKVRAVGKEREEMKRSAISAFLCPRRAQSFGCLHFDDATSCTELKL